MNLYTEKNSIDYKKNDTLTDYTKISEIPKDYTEYYLCFIVGSVALGMLFYDDLLIGLLLCCLAPFFERVYGSIQRDKRINEIRDDFKDSLYTIASSVAAGRQMPKAILDAKEQADLFIGEDSVIAIELGNIYERYLERNEDISYGLLDFSKRCSVDEISLFAESFTICKRTGGNIEKICLKSAYMIIEKIEFASEVRAIFSEKKLDAVIMTIMPLILLFFLNLSSPDYIAVLYQSIKGRVVMTIALILITSSMLWSLKIMNLKV